jgi:hypothetical protein
MDRRFAILSKALRDEVAYARFVADFAEILNRRQASKTANSAQDHDFFRYHDSGDVQSVTHLEMINERYRRVDPGNCTLAAYSRDGHGRRIPEEKR